MTGFETIGNATVTVFDNGHPVLTTDPWIAGEPYFGSWTAPFEIPTAQLEHILDADYMWLSHGHPDHVHMASLEQLTGKKVLLPDHVGGRMARDLGSAGFSVRVLPDRQWVRLTPQIRVMCISDYHQDAVLLIDVAGQLIVNLNDAVERGWGRFVRSRIREYKVSFLLKLFGYGDVDMINIFTEDGAHLMHAPPTASREALAQWDAYLEQKVRFWGRYFGTTYVVPFSIFHAYQRKDSAWAREYVTPLEAYQRIRFPKGTELLPAFGAWNVVRDEWTPFSPQRRKISLRDPKEFGDDWSEMLEPEEVKLLTGYFQGIEFLRSKLDAIRFRVGGREHTIDIGKRTGRSMTFEVPRHSLVAAVRMEVFDDILIGNFAKLTLHGDWGTSLAPNVLYRYFTPWVVRYADNGRVRTNAALDDYFEQYRRRARLEYLFHSFEREGVQRLRAVIHPGTFLFRTATRLYSFAKR
jgi:hypothetical protein